MRVLQLGKFYPVKGGVEKVALSLTEGLAHRGIDCDMLCTYTEGTLGGFSHEPGPDLSRIVHLCENGRVICVKSRLTLAKTTFSLRMMRYLRKHAAEYDIIHIHHPDPMAAIALLLSRYKGRVILHWHSDILSQKVALAIYKPIQNWLIGRAEKIVGTTPVYLASSPFLKHCPEKHTCIPIGVNPLQYNKERTDALRAQYVSDGERLILSIGRLVPYKGYEHLINAMSLLDDSYHLVIGGMGPLQNELQALIERLSLSSRVSLAGYVGANDLPDWFHACDVFVLSSVMKTEAFGIVQIEAFSCGKPVVTSVIEGSGVSWVNENDVSGINVPSADPKAIADAIMAIFSSPQLYERYSRGARERFEKVFTKDKMIDATIKLYETH